jgi:signal transduction histidine kinase/sensor domain CHASE-containing protein/HAMP domain-containing protein
MQFTIRSLGGKLIIVATFTLLLCLLLITIFSWSTLRYYTESQAKKDAQAHLSSLQQVYQSHTHVIIQDLEKLTKQLPLATTDTQESSQTLTQYLQGAFAALSTSDHVTTLDVLSPNYVFIARGNPLSATNTNKLSPNIRQLINQTQAAKTLTAFIPMLPATRQQAKRWYMYIATSLTNTGDAHQHDVVLETIPLDNTFAQVLTEQTNQNASLCINGQVVGISKDNNVHLVTQHAISMQQFCQAGEPTIIDTKLHDLVEGQIVQTPSQSAKSPAPVIVTVETLYNLSVSDPRPLFIILGLGIFVLALGIIIYTFTVSVLLIRPLRRLQTHAHMLVANNTGIQIGPSRTNEITMLANSFNLLSDSLYSESQALLEQMGHLLVMSDALMSTLNLEQLLGEFVFHIGYIMKVHHVSLMLYGRERGTPWAVAQWEPDQDNFNERGHSTVHVDPDGDITMAVTTKMAALPAIKSSSRSGKRTTLRPAQPAQPASEQHSANQVNAPQYKQSVRQPRIPHSALRDVDLLLTRMAIQRQKIVCGEDIDQIYQERKDHWANVALKSGYHGAIAVPLMLREQPIGAFILYTAKPYKVSSRDTFLLSTASMQTSMAIQNAMLYAEVKDKNAALERANHLKSQFLANVTHELRTPLHSIISYGALILEGFVDGDLNSEQEEHIQFIVRRAEDLSHLVDDMLDLSKIEADRIEVKPASLAIDQFLTEIIHQLKAMAISKNLYLRLEIEEDIPMVIADSHRLRQVAINLVSNAIKFTEKGGVTIRYYTLQDRDMLCISIADTGIGIAPAALGYIFEAFRQADESTTRRFGGTGLGLTIAKRLIELQGGEIAVESMPGEGTTFSFTLPLSAS